MNKIFWDILIATLAAAFFVGMINLIATVIKGIVI